jgi:hypothetical protein
MTVAQHAAHFRSLIVGPLQVNVVAKKHEWHENCSPFTREEHFTNCNPDYLVHYVATGADNATNAYHRYLSQATHDAMTIMVDRACAQADRILPWWKEESKYHGPVLEKMLKDSVKLGIKLITTGDIISTLIRSMIPTPWGMWKEARRAATNTTFFSAVDDFIELVEFEVDHRVVPSFVRDIS